MKLKILLVFLIQVPVLSLSLFINNKTHSSVFHRKPASESKMFESKDVFLPNYSVYSDANGTRLVLAKKKITTSLLTEVQLISVVDGAEKSGSSKYVYATAKIGTSSHNRYKIWVHGSAATPLAVSELKGAGNTNNQMPWGDPRLTEMYQKNYNQRISWFDHVKQFFDPNSKLGMQMIAGISDTEDLNNQEEYYYVVNQENDVPILAENGQDTGKFLDPGSVVIVSLLRKYSFDKNKQQYIKTQDFISSLVKFRTAENFYGDPIIHGYLHIGNLKEAIRPLEDLKKLSENYDRYIPVLKGMFHASDNNLTLDQALRQFHSTMCTVEGVSKDALLKKWQKFIESKESADAKQIAKNAQHVDIVARTIMGEAQTESHLYDPNSIQILKNKIFHPMAVSCQRDIIALSIRNRAMTNQFSAYGHRYLGDFTGAASTGSQYNAWFDNLVPHASYRITSCFYSANEKYLKSRFSRDKSYKTYQQRYQSLIKRLPLIFGIEKQENKAASEDNRYLNKLFLANRGSKQNNSADINANIVASFRHYYHPNNGGLKKGNAQFAINNQNQTNVKFGYVLAMLDSDINSGQYRIYPITDGKLTRFDKDKNPYKFDIRLKGSGYSAELFGEVRLYKFEILVKNNWVDPDNFFQENENEKITALLMEPQLETEMIAANNLWALLPNAVFPHCFEKDGQISNSALKHGVRVPMHWFSKEVRNHAAYSFNKLLYKNNEALQKFMGGSYYAVDRKKSGKKSLYTENGEPVQLQCVDPVYYSEQHKEIKNGLPEFGGYCDPNIMLVRGI
ncbi:MAG: hypothetical protein M9962_10135 [Oligoflexia bacterium]|nr:hypothetical protein [Oligoflexia bacterium]